MMAEIPAYEESPPIAPGNVDEHTAKRNLKARCAILTISDSRSLATDESGRSIRGLLETGGHGVLYHEIIKNDPSILRKEVSRLLGADLDLIITSGGTGISHKDFTIETIEPMLEKRLSGFGELFRYLSFREIHSRAFMSRALGGVVKGKLLFALPGSVHAVKLALEELILPQLGHLIWEVNR
jgi:molybdopterin adenylyltransferase